MMERTFYQTKFFLKEGDITRENCDAIVNAANSGLMGGGGVDGAIHRAAGPRILEECKKITRAEGPCRPGNAVLTTGGNLTARFVIHTVGPIWTGGRRNEIEILRRCYQNSLALAKKSHLKTVSFPSISTGAYRFPLELAAPNAQSAIVEVLSHEPFFEKVGFVLFDEQTFQAYQRALKQINLKKTQPTT